MLAVRLQPIGQAPGPNPTTTVVVRPGRDGRNVGLGRLVPGPLHVRTAPYVFPASWSTMSDDEMNIYLCPTASFPLSIGPVYPYSLMLREISLMHNNYLGAMQYAICKI
jgi:hypothetical protein